MKGDIVRRSMVDKDTRAAMYELFCQQFSGVSFDVFSDDLDEKNWVLLLHSDAGVLCGFSSMHIYDVRVADEDIAVVYSGDTVVNSETWNDSALSYYWMGAIDTCDSRIPSGTNTGSPYRTGAAGSRWHPSSSNSGRSRPRYRC